MNRYLSCYRMGVGAALQYRTAALAGVVTQFAWGFMEILAFGAFYHQNPAAFPMEFSQTVSYIWMQQAFLALFMNWFYENDIFAAITSGAVAYELVRPLDLYNRWFCQNLATRSAKTLLRCFPILAIAFVLPAPFRLQLPPSGLVLLFFGVSALLALGVVVSFAMLVYISTFYTLSPLGVRLAAAVLADFFAGSVIPLPFFPEGIRRFASLLPFAAMQNMPLRIYSGNISGTGVLQGLLLQVFWLCALVAIGRRMMKHALKRVIIQGG